MVKIKDMEKFVEDTEEQANLWEEVEQNDAIPENDVKEEESLINQMFWFADEDEEEEQKTEEEQIEEEQEEQETDKDKEQEQTEEEVKEDTGQEEGDVNDLIDEILEQAEEIWGEEVDKAVQEVQDAIEEGAPDDEILQKISELEEALANETLANETLSKERDRLLNKLNELQDKLSEYEVKSYDMKPVEMAIEADPWFKGFVRILAMYKTNPEKVGKERLINVLDQFIVNEFGVSVSDLLEEKANEESKKMETGEEKQAIEISIDTGDKNPIDEMFDI